MKTMLLAAALAGFFSTMAFGLEVTPVPIMTPDRTEIPGHQIDIRGVVTGMSADEVRAAILSIEGVEIQERMSETRLSESGEVVTSPYLGLIAGVRDGDNILAALTGAASGNQVNSVMRQAQYSSDSAPIGEVLIASLVEKYGPPSRQATNPWTSRLYWTFKGGHQVECDRPGPMDQPTAPKCPASPENLVSGDTPNNFDYAMMATIDIDTSGRARTFTMWAVDIALMIEADEVDRTALRPELDRLIGEARANAPVPAL